MTYTEAVKRVKVLRQQDPWTMYEAHEGPSLKEVYDQ